MQINQIPLSSFIGAGRMSTRLQRLSQVSLLGQLTPTELGIVDSLLHQRQFMTGEVIFDEGEEGQAIYIIEEGEVTIGRKSVEAIGQIATLKAGDFFGEMALLDNLPRAAQARACAPAKLLVFFRVDFVNLMDTHARIASKIALQIAREMGRRLRLAHSSEPQAWRQHL